MEYKEIKERASNILEDIYNQDIENLVLLEIANQIIDGVSYDCWSMGFYNADNHLGKIQNMLHEIIEFPERYSEKYD